MKFEFRAILTLLVFGSALAAAAAEPLAVDVDTAVAIALRSNLGIESERLGLEVKRNAKDTVYNYFYPKLNASIKLNRSNRAPSTVQALIPDTSSATSSGTYDSVLYYSYTPEHSFELGAGISASLALSTSMIHGIRLALLDYEAGLLNLETVRKKLELDVKKTFFNLLLIQQSIKLNEQNLQAAETRYSQALGNYKSGLIDEYSLLSAQVSMESLKPVIEDVKNAFSTTLLSFKTLLGLELDKELQLSGSIEPVIIEFDAKKLSARFLANRLDIQGLVLAGKITENVSKLENSNLLPTLTFLYSVDPTFTGDPFGDSWFDEDWKQRSGMFGITLSMSLDNLLPQSAQRNKIFNAEIDREKTKVQLSQALQAADLEVRRIIMGLEKSSKSIEVLKLNVNLADKANRMGQEAFKAGLKDYSQIETTEVNLQEAKFKLLQEKFNYLTGLLDLENALNTSINEIKGLVK